MRVPVVEDQVFLAEAIQTGLRPEATTADLAHDGDAALAMVDINDDDILILDRDIPGTQHRRGLREHPSARAHWGIRHGARHGSLTAGRTASAARWWCGVPPRECSAWKIASATSCCACSFSSR